MPQRFKQSAKPRRARQRRNLSPQAHVGEENPGGRAGSREQRHEKRAGVGLRARELEPSFVPSAFQPHFLVLLTRIPIPIPLPAAARGGGSRLLRSVPARGSRRGGGVSSRAESGKGGCEGRSRACPGSGDTAARAREGFTRSGGTALPRRGSPGRSPPARGPRARELGERCQGPGKSFRQRPRYQVQDVTRNSPRHCCQAVLKQATSQKGLKHFRHVIFICVFPLEGSLKSSAGGRGLQYHLYAGLCVRCSDGRRRKVSRLCSVQASRGLQHLRVHLYPPPTSGQWRQDGKSLLAHA